MSPIDLFCTAKNQLIKTKNTKEVITKKSVDQDQVGEQSESGGKEAKGTPGVLDPSPTRMVAALA